VTDTVGPMRSTTQHGGRSSRLTRFAALTGLIVALAMLSFHAVTRARNPVWWALAVLVVAVGLLWYASRDHRVHQRPALAIGGAGLLVLGIGSLPLLGVPLIAAGALAVIGAIGGGDGLGR
jgi:hypothetical protein